MPRRYNRYFFRRIIFGAPSLIIFGIIYLFFDPEIGGAMLAVGVVFSIILVVDIIRRRRRGPSRTATITHTGHQPSTGQQPIHYQPLNTEQDGTQAVNNRFCSHCGGKNEIEVKYCINCGANL